MPHKRAKRSAREKQRSQSGLNLPPGTRNAIECEEIPKGAARILNAAKVQEQYREKKRKMQEGSSERGPSAKRRKSESKDRGDTGTESRTELRIQPGESMAHFNRRVEDSLRGQVRVAMKTSSALARKAKKEEEESSRASKGKQNAKLSPKSDDAPSSPSQSTSTPKPSIAREKPDDFERLSTSAPRRLNDIVQAPPELKKLPRGAKQRPKVPEPTALGEGTATLRQGALSMAQKAMLEEERLKAIKLYREMKKAKTGE